ncbi:hypothetical protein HDU76_008264 [Blyttiomyces sp. JEL0837]|nr:hypothetical protein HDU76_008264 [Blyttiomyces sp. JEL0837]
MIAKVFNTYSYTATAFNPKAGENGEPGFVGLEPAQEAKMQVVKGSFKNLTLSILVGAELTKKIAAAQRQNDYEVELPRGVRLGYMGHLTYISDEVCKLMEKCVNDFEGDAYNLVTSEEWLEYVSGVLRETKERDRQPLGGVRPTQTGGASLPMVTGAGGLDDADMGISVAALRKKSEAAGGGSGGGSGVDSDDDDDELGAGATDYLADGDVSSDQFARYLCQQIVGDFPDRGILGGEGDGSDEEREEVDVTEDAEWLGDAAGFEGENPFPNKLSSLGDEFDDVTSDDDTSARSGRSSDLPPIQPILSNIMERQESSADSPDGSSLVPPGNIGVPSISVRSPSVPLDMSAMANAISDVGEGGKGSITEIESGSASETASIVTGGGESVASASTTTTTTTSVSEATVGGVTTVTSVSSTSTVAIGDGGVVIVEEEKKVVVVQESVGDGADGQ